MMEQKVEYAEILPRVLEDFFPEGSPVVFNPEQFETNKILDDGRVSLGWRVTWFSRGTDNLFHEMAHFVEIDERRMSQPSYGLKVPRVWIYDRFCSEPRTMQISARELRVFAYQHHIHEHYGIPTWRNKATDLLSWLPDYHLIPGRGFRRNDTHTNWILAHYDRLVRSKKYQFQVFREEWDRRLVILAKRIKKRRKKPLTAPLNQ